MKRLELYIHNCRECPYVDARKDHRGIREYFCCELSVMEERGLRVKVDIQQLPPEWCPLPDVTENNNDQTTN